MRPMRFAEIFLAEPHCSHSYLRKIRVVFRREFLVALLFKHAVEMKILGYRCRDYRGLEIYVLERKAVMCDRTHGMPYACTL